MNTISSGCARHFAVDQQKNVPPAAKEEIQAPHSITKDFSHDTWSRAFEKLADLLKHEYALTEHKKIDWDARKKRYLPQVIEAERAKDPVAFYTALREFGDIHDAHFSIVPETQANGKLVLALMKSHIGGSFGFTVAKTDKDEVIVTSVEKGSQVEKEGIQPGDRVLKKNDAAILTALTSTSTLWADNQAATKEVEALERACLIVRAPIGEKATFLIATAQHGEKLFSLSAFDDDFRGYESQEFSKDLSADVISYKMIKPKIGYIRIDAEFDPKVAAECMQHRDTISDAELIDRVADPVIHAFQKALDFCIREGATSLIIDLRNNHGGTSKAVVKIAGHFYESPSPYIVSEVFKNGHFSKIDLSYSSIQPEKPLFKGNVITLIGAGTFSSGEGLAWALSNKGPLIGFDATSGNFAAPELNVLLPGGWKVQIPNQRNIIGKGNLIIDGNAEMKGGITPTIRVPKTKENLLRNQHTDVLLEQAIHLRT